MAAAAGVSLGALALWALVAIALIVAIIAIVQFFRSQAQITAALGTVVGGSGPPPANGLSQGWTSPPTQLTVGTPATFVFTVSSMNTSGTVRAVQGRQYIIDVQPSANLTIQSMTGSLAVAPGAAETSVAGTITVVVLANSLPTPSAPELPPSGSLVAIQINDTAGASPFTANFTVR